MARIHPAYLACEVPVFFATTDGQTRRIAERLAAAFRERGFSSRAVDTGSSDANGVDWAHVKGALVGASLHGGRHQRAAAAFVRTHASELNRRPAAFFSVSLSAASQNLSEHEEAKRLARDFPAQLGWRAGTIVCFAGRLAYTRYGLLKRFIMKRIARKEGASTDTSRDHEYTNWNDVEQLASDMVVLIGHASRRANQRTAA